MALDIGTSPALATNAGNGVTGVTTASFTRPAAGSILVASVMAFAQAGGTVSGGGLTWERQVQLDSGNEVVEIWTADVTGSGSMTVSVSGLSGGLGVGVGLKVWAVTGQHETDYIGAVGSNTSTANNLSVVGYVSTANNSRGFFAAMEGAGLGNPTVGLGDTGFPWTADPSLGAVSGIAINKAANTATSGSDVSFNADAPGATAADWTWAALEILPGGLNAEVTTEMVATAVAVPAPDVGVGGERTAGPAAATTSLPAPDVSAGAGVTPATVAAAAAVPVPSVTTEDVEIVTPTTVATAADVPTPAVTASADATLQTIEAIAALYAPDVSAGASVTLDTIAVVAEVPDPSVTVPVLPGDAITRPGQIEWNGFLLGSGTPYSWQQLDGWVDSAPFVSGNVDRPDSSGSYPGQPYTAERAINWGMLIKAPRATIGQVVHDLVMATGPAQTEDEGWLVIWDFDDLQPWLVRAHFADRLPGPINHQARLGLMRGALQWIASDPRRYDPVRSSLTIAKDVPTSILNNGNDATPGELRFPGPATGIQVENLTTDRVIAFSTAIGVSETLVIDVKEGTVAIGDVNHLNDLVEGSTSVQDFVFDPGANELLYTADAGGDAGMETFWRHAVS